MNPDAGAQNAGTEPLDAVVNDPPLAIISTDREGLIRSWDAAAEQMLGWSEAEVLGKLMPIRGDEQRSRFCKLMEQVLSGRMFTGLEFAQQHRDGSSIDVSFSAAPWWNSDGSVIGMIVLMADTSARKRAEAFEGEQPLRQVPKIDPVGIAHEFNNLLMVISTYTELILDNIPRGSVIARNARQIADACERATALTRQLGCKQSLQPVRLDFAKLTSDCNDMPSHEAARLTKAPATTDQTMVARGLLPAASFSSSKSRR